MKGNEMIWKWIAREGNEMNGNEGEKKIISVSILPIWISFSFWRKNADHHFLYYSLMNHFIGILWGAPNFLKSLRSSCQDCIRCTCHAYLMGFLAPFLQAGMVEPCWSLLMGDSIIRTETLERRFCRPNSKPHLLYVSFPPASWGAAIRDVPLDV